MMQQPVSDGIVHTSARKGTCATCGAKDVVVSSPPSSRHVDAQACEQQRKLNRQAYLLGRVKIGVRR